MTRQLVVNLEGVRLNKNFDEDRKKTYTCYVCMAKFASTLNLNKHKALHSDSEVEDDIFEEETSPKSKTESTTKNIPNGGRENETRSETSDKPKCVVIEQTQKVRTFFRCDPCDVFFEGSDDAKLHKITNKCKFSCRICNRKFNTLYAFVVHIMQHRSNSSKSNNPSQMVYTCTTCKMSFHNCLLLRSHEINKHNQKSDNPSRNVDAAVNNGESKHSEQSDNNSRIPDAAVNNVESTHNEQSDNTLRISEFPINAPIEEANATIKTEPIELSVHDQFQNSNITTDEPKEICCELCYDVFQSEEELKSHMEFHEQLENSSQTIVIEDDEEEVVEVYEEKKDPHEIITTIKSRPPQKKAGKTYVGPNLTIPTVSPKGTSNQKLTAAIKDMLTPRDEKQPKVVHLTPPMPNLRSASQLRQKAIENAAQNVTAPTNASNVELRKTGPFSYALHFKVNDAGSSGTSSSPTTTETGNVNLKTSSSNSQSTFPQYGSALVNSNQVASGVTSNVMNNPKLQFAITGIPHVSEVQVTPWSTPTINAFDNVKQNASTLPTISIATTSANNVTYVMSPTTRFTSPIVLNDPQKKLAYLILPHANNDVVNASTAVTNAKSIVLATNARAVITPELSKQQSISPTEKTSQSSTVAAAASATSTKENLLPVVSDPSSTLKETGTDIPTSTTASTSKLDGQESSIQKDVIESIVIDSDSSNDGTPNVSKKETNTTNECESDELIIDEGSSAAEQLPENESLEADLRTDEKLSRRKWKFPMKCDGCQVVFHRLRSMRHHLERRRRCQLCPFRCCKVSDFKQHYILEHRKFFCSRCSCLADTKTAFTEHNRRTHICQTCNGFYFNLVYHTCHKLTENDKSNGKNGDRNGENAEGKA